MIQSVLHAESASTGSNYALASDVLFLRIQDGSARLLDLGGNFYAISQTGAHMLDKTLAMGPASAAASIAAEYHCDLSCVEHDLAAFLRDLEKKRLIRSTRWPRARGNRKYLSSLLLVPCLQGLSLLPVSQRNRTWLLLALAGLAVRLAGWPTTVACWQASFARVRPCRWVLGEQAVREVHSVVCRVAGRHLFPLACKERALSCWWLLQTMGVAATLVVGVSVFPLECHCWCEAGPYVLSDARDRCQQFLPVLRYGREPGPQMSPPVPLGQEPTGA
jgi:hypothetical protein